LDLNQTENRSPTTGIEPPAALARILRAMVDRVRPAAEGVRENGQGKKREKYWKDMALHG
jgi:hypothetical protein